MDCTAAGTPICLSAVDVARSALLQQLGDSRGAFDLPFRAEHVQAWQALRTDTNCRPAFNDLEAGLKVRSG